MVGIYVGGYLEDEAGKLWLLRLDCALFGHGGTRRGSYLYETVEQFLHSKVVKGRPKEHWCHLCTAVGFDVKLRIDSVYKLQVVAQLSGISLSNLLVKLVGVDVYLHFLRHTLFVWREEVQLLLVNVINAFEPCALIDRPREGSNVYLQFVFQLVEEVEGVSSLAVHLVYEDYHGSVPHTANLHELPCLRLNAFSSINNDDGRIHCGERSICVFGKVLVSRRIENVDLILRIGAFGSVVELHHRCADRYSALLLNVHPVACRGLAYLVVLHSSGHLNLSAEEQELLGERRLTRIGMADDGKGASSFYFLVHLY